MYSSEIKRDQPSCLLFLIDQSSSMGGPFGGDPKRIKAQGVADAINRLLQNLVIRCTREDGVRGYYEIGVIGYGGPLHGSVFGGALAGRGLVPISEVADNPVRVESRKRDDGVGGVVDFMLPIWFDPVAHGGTPMCDAFHRAQVILRGWVAAHPASYPPIVINLTDGEATDGNPTLPAEELRRLGTTDGNTLLFNCHVSSRQETPVLFPDNELAAPDQHARLLFQISSVLPAGILAAAHADGFSVGDSARGFAFNAELVDVIRFLDIGTKQDLR